MPVKNGHGYSKDTPAKQEQFSMIAKTLLTASGGIIRRNHWMCDTFFYFDLTAGCGVDEKGIEGSPIRFLKLALNSRIKTNALLVEERIENYYDLQENIKKLVPDAISFANCRFGNHLEILPQWIQEEAGKYKIKKLGLCYVDPTGSAPPFDLLSGASQSEHFSMIDFLVYCSPANIKRIRCCPTCSYDEYLVDSMRRINKSYWIVREPVNRHQWTFLIGTNWNAFPSFKNRGFYPVESLKGREILRRLNYSAKELQNAEQIAIPYL